MQEEQIRSLPSKSSYRNVMLGSGGKHLFYRCRFLRYCVFWRALLLEMLTKIDGTRPISFKRNDLVKGLGLDNVPHSGW